MTVASVWNDFKWEFKRAGAVIGVGAALAAGVIAGGHYLQSDISPQLPTGGSNLFSGTFNDFGHDASTYSTVEQQSCDDNPSSASAVETALGSATGGDVICLAAGTYGAISTSDTFASDVIIQPAPGATVHLDGLTIGQASHQIWQGFISDQGSGGSIYGSTDITFRYNSNYLEAWQVCQGLTGCGDFSNHVTNANIKIQHNRFDNIQPDCIPNCFEARLNVTGSGGGIGGDTFGVTITDNHFGGTGCNGDSGVGCSVTSVSNGSAGCSDGIQEQASPIGIQVGPGNKFEHFDQNPTAFPCDDPPNEPCKGITCINQAHVDAMQLQDSNITDWAVTGNFCIFNNGDGCMASFDSSDNVEFTNNVVVCDDGSSCGHNPVTTSGAQNWTHEHNTYWNGNLQIEDGGKGAPTGNDVHCNAWIDSGGVTWSGSFGTESYNLNSGLSGTGDISGTPTIQGSGSPPTDYYAYLIIGGDGLNACDDGKNMGIDDLG